MMPYIAHMKKNRTLLLIAIFIFIAGCTGIKYGPNKAHDHKDAQTNRLLDDVVPLNYDVSLWADPSKEVFLGQVGIDFLLKKNRESIL